MCERHLPLTLKVASKTVAGVYLCVCVRVCAYTLNCNYMIHNIQNTTSACSAVVTV